MKIIITGASGFIGTQAVQQAVDKGWEVHALARAIPSKTLGAHWHAVDLFDHDYTRTIVADIAATHLLHLAWIATPGLFWNDPSNLQWVSGSLNLCQEFVRRGGRYILGSGSCAEYRPGLELYAERSELLPESLYGVSKVSLYQLLERFTQLESTRFAWGRIFFVYGHREPIQKFIHNAVLSAASVGEIVLREPRRLLDYIHVRDVASAFIYAIERGVAGPFNVGTAHGSTPQSLSMVIARAFERLGRVVTVREESLASSGPDIVSAPSALMAAGWKPSVTIEEGIAHYLSALGWDHAT